jgi:acetylornithine deacetylase/succinyl-diaminopimelate desuccinylase-like protein
MVHAPAGYSSRVTIERVKDYLAAHRDDLVGQLSDWVRIPSIPGVPEHEVDLARSANWLAGVLRDDGFPTVEVWDADGAPAVYAAWCAGSGCTNGPYARPATARGDHHSRLRRRPDRRGAR